MSNSNQEKWYARLIDAMLPILATIAALLVGAVMLLLLKVKIRHLWLSEKDLLFVLCYRYKAGLNCF